MFRAILRFFLCIPKELPADIKPSVPSAPVPSNSTSQPLTVDGRSTVNDQPLPPTVSVSNIEGQSKAPENVDREAPPPPVISQPVVEDQHPPPVPTLLVSAETQPAAPGNASGGRLSPAPPVVDVSPRTLELIVSAVTNIANIRQPGLSQAAQSAVDLTSSVQNVQSNTEQYEQIAADACQFVFVVADQLRQEGHKSIDGNLQSSLEDIAGIFGDIQNLVESNASENSWSAFFNSDTTDDLETIKGKLEQRMKMFNIQSFADLRNQANKRAKSLSPSGGGTGNSNRKHDEARVPQHGNRINQQDNGPIQQSNSRRSQRNDTTVHHADQHGATAEMFSHASGFDIRGGNFTNIGGTLNETTYNAKNVSANYGKLYGQNLGDGGNINFNGFPPGF